MERLLEQATWKTIWSSVLACISWLLGGFDAPLYALGILYIMDFGLGFYRAWMAECVSASRFRNGCGKFLLYSLVIVAAHMLDLVLRQPLPYAAQYVRDVMCLFLAINEFLSVSTHLNGLGVRLPRWLIDRLRSYRDTGSCIGMPAAVAAAGSTGTGKSGEGG